MPWCYWPFRILASVIAILFGLQAVLAGQLMSGRFGALLAHQNNAALADFALIAALPAAVLVRWPGRGPWWPMVAVPALFGLSAAQSTLGFGRVLAVHVPLGVVIIVLALALAIWSWRHPRAHA